MAGVAIKTVSRVMNDEPNVTPATADRVRRAVAELQYVPDIAAGSLRRSDRRTRTIGLLVADVTDPFFAQVHRAVEDAASARGYATFASSSDEDPVKERQAVAAFAHRHVDGLILASTLLEGSSTSDTPPLPGPVVHVDRPGVVPAGDVVVADNDGAAHAAVAGLLRRGHSAVGGLFDSSTLWTAHERFDGARRAIEQRGGASLVTAWDVGTEEAAARAVTAMMQAADPPTALFAARSTITVGAVRALRRLGLQHSVALIGFDDFITSDLLQPGVTVIAQRPSHIGRVAATRLFARLGDERGEPQWIVVPCDLIQRGSGEITPTPPTGGRRR